MKGENMRSLRYGAGLFVVDVGLALLATYLAPPAQAQTAQQCSGGTYKTFAFEAITVGATAVGFTTATFAPDNIRDAEEALVSVETDNIRFRSDGIAPTSTVGHQATPGQFIVICGKQNVKNFQMIRSGSADATASVTYFRQ